jgi:GNAT superfamily N-acetyltransferase
MQVQPLNIQDLPHTQHLQPSGWGDININLLQYCLHDFCKPVKVVDKNRIVGIGAAILHRDSAWLAHIIVDESYRGRGIGYKIVKNLLEVASKNDASSVNLIATDLGVPVYEKAGFKMVGPYQFLKRTHAWISKQVSHQLKPARPDHYEQILKLDLEINGENRKRLIEGHLNQSIVFEKEGLVEGYYFPKLGQGPIYAATAHAGLSLMALKYSANDVAVIPADNDLAITFLLQNGFEKQDTTAVRMTYGRETIWQPEKIFSRIGGNYG